MIAVVQLRRPAIEYLTGRNISACWQCRVNGCAILINCPESTGVVHSDQNLHIERTVVPLSASDERIPGGVSGHAEPGRSAGHRHKEYEDGPLSELAAFESTETGAAQPWPSKVTRSPPGRSRRRRRSSARRTIPTPCRFRRS